jgi:hypothetical protein
VIDLDSEMRFWLDALGLESAGWKVTWGWVDDIELDNGGWAYGLNSLNSDERSSHIKIRKLYTERDKREFVDTCAHEMSHCFGAEVERRILEAQSEVDRVNAHEYIAETLAPALTRIKGTPREKAFAKAIKVLSGKTEAFAKAARQLPARAKEAKMDLKAILAMLAMIGAASTPEEKEKLLAALMTQIEGMNGGAVEPAAVPLAAEPPKPEDEALPPAAKPLEEPGLAKVIDVLIMARPDLTKEQQAFAKARKTALDAAEYISTIPLAKAPQEPKPPAAKPLDDKAPRPGEGNGQMRLGKTDKDSMLSVAKAMGQATEPVRGPTILTKPDGRKAFSLGNLTPTQYRERRASGWDPRKSFPLASEVAQ